MKRITTSPLLALCASGVATAQPLLVCAADTHVGRRGDHLNGQTNQVDNDVWEWEIGSGDTYRQGRDAAMMPRSHG